MEYKKLIQLNPMDEDDMKREYGVSTYYLNKVMRFAIGTPKAIALRIIALEKYKYITCYNEIDRHEMSDLLRLELSDGEKEFVELYKKQHETID